MTGSHSALLNRVDWQWICETS